MRILFLIDRIPADNQGADAYTTRIAGIREALERQGVETDVLSLRTLRFHRPHALFALNAAAIGRIGQGYDIIHAAGAGATVAACVAQGAHRRPVIFDMQGDEPLETAMEWQSDHSMRRAFLLLQASALTPLAARRADLTLVVSEAFRARAVRRGAAPDRVVVVPNGVDLNLFRAEPPAGKRLCFAYAGSFQAWQSIDILIDAFEYLESDCAHLHLIGFAPDNPADVALKNALARRLGSRVTLEDRVPPDQLPGHLTSAHVLVIPRTAHPAMQGGLPSKFAEYLALGRPVIVTDVDDCATYVREHQCGLICAPTAAGFNQALHEALDWDANQRIQMGQRARSLAESTFNWEVIAAQYLQVLERLCGQPRASVSASSHKLPEVR
ncbi:MAG TPA: glycosyltransferase family 4 protein [Phototrophicaceae bacterium]|nr:glycosyltransferase family 4 protein [Phototrophicaceae bacterium]